jgi:hypothetical protein
MASEAAWGVALHRETVIRPLVLVKCTDYLPETSEASQSLFLARLQSGSEL